MSQNRTPQTRAQRNYAWTVALAGAVAVFCALGLGRFAFGMLLPSMSQTLGLSYSQAGLLGFANMAGYLIGVLLIPLVLPRLRARATIVASLGLIAGSMAGMAFTGSFAVLCALYTLTGIGSAGVVLPSMSSMSQWFYPSHRGLAAGIVMAGSGFGIILSGFILPQLSPQFGLVPWQIAWLIFAAITALAIGLCLALFRNRPSEIGKLPAGRTPEKTTASAPVQAPRAKLRLLAQLGLAYGIYGATYMIYVTFIVTSMVDAYGMTKNASGNLWAWFGLLSVFSGILFGWISDRLGRRAGMAVAFGVLGTAYMLVGFGSAPGLLYVSVTLFGLAAWSIPVIIAASAGDYFGPTSAANVFAVLTIVFSAGQGIGPVVAGFLAEKIGDFQVPYALSGGLAVLAIVLIVSMRPPAVSE
ncbi:MFS transporter [Roseovarius dicentrarchi]|uniref:MFS transporter n=1 Tax=Roseovarius dicentrarchi TaxID=2250573 RepID=UPI000DE836AC|nr:YbfB/YjiJ family MFS transporter [Roseovarius dicentrarchi]